MTIAEFTEKHGLPWEQWYAMTPLERWNYSHKVLCPKCLELGGSLGPEWDPTDPMHETYIEMGIYEQSDIPPQCLVAARQQRESYVAKYGIRPGDGEWQP